LRQKVKKNPAIGRIYLPQSPKVKKKRVKFSKKKIRIITFLSQFSITIAKKEVK
jgi:hypothetical protein